MVMGLFIPEKLGCHLLTTSLSLPSQMGHGPITRGGMGDVRQEAGKENKGCTARLEVSICCPSQGCSCVIPSATIYAFHNISSVLLVRKVVSGIVRVSLSHTHTPGLLV